MNIFNSEKVTDHELYEEIKQVFSEIEDTRQYRRTNHSLVEVLFIVISAMLAGANSLAGIEIFIEERAEWISKRLILANGFPCRATIWRVLQAIDPKNISIGLSKLLKRFFHSYDGQICIDGKVSRAFRDSENEGRMLNVVSAFATEVGVVMSQVGCDAKSNEIPAMRELIDLLNIKGCTITADALHCQKETAELIHKKGGYYLLALKGNQEILHQEAKELFDQLPSDPSGYEFYEEYDKGHGRIEHRKIWIYRELDWIPKNKRWLGLKAMIMVETSRWSKSQGEQLDRRWYLTSSNEKAENLLCKIRAHWLIENQCHWCLDIIFDEDRAQGRDRKFAMTLASLRRFCLSILRLDKERKVGLKHQRSRAAMNPAYLDKLWGLLVC